MHHPVWFSRALVMISSLSLVRRPADCIRIGRVGSCEYCMVHKYKLSCLCFRTAGVDVYRQLYHRCRTSLSTMAGELADARRAAGEARTVTTEPGATGGCAGVVC